MKQLKNQLISLRIKPLWILSLFFLLFTLKVNAQDDLNLNNVTNNISLQNDTSYQDFIIPATADYNAIYLEAYGADGGDATNISTSGGKGAKIAGYLRLGDNAVPAGSTIRFIVGVKGGSKGEYGGGGGGTAIAVKRKGESSWYLIMVAGGGGGAGLKTSGREGTTSTSGSNGKWTNAYSDNLTIDTNAGTNGNGGGVGTQYKGDAGCGGGIYTAGEGLSDFGGSAGLTGDVPTGNAGGIGTQNQGGSANWANGGWGFGGGGAGYQPSSSQNTGGGGGGYSGGGSGINDGAGGGGGSYVNSAFVENDTRTSNGNTSSPANGAISYRFDHLPELEKVQLTYTPSKGDATPLCLGINGSTPASGDQLKAVDCSNTDQTDWVIEGARLRLNADLSLCLDLKNASTSDNNPIQLYECNESGAQNWIYDGYQTALRYKSSITKCATVNESSYYVSIGQCAESHNQWWTMDGAATTPSFGANPSTRRITMNAQSDKCIDIKSANTANKTNIQLYNCNETTAQKWFFNGAQIKMYDHQDKCLDLSNGNTGDGTNIWLYSCSANNSNQNWIYDGLTQAIRLQKQPDKCLDIDDTNLASGANLQLKTCNGGTTQQFNITPATEVLFGSINNVKNSTQCIDLSTDNYSNGTNIQTNTWDESTTQYWYVQNNQIKLAETPFYCFALTKLNAVSGDNIHLWECKDQDNEKWYYDGFTQMFRTKTDPKYCLTADGTNIELNTCTTGNTNQQWKVPDAPVIDVTTTGRTNTISKAATPTLLVYPQEGRTQNGSQVITQTLDASMDQSLRFNSDGSISIAKRTDRCLDQLSGSTAEGTKIQVFPCTGYDNQKWIYDMPEQLFRAFNNPDMCLTGGSNGASVTLSTCSGSDDQKFIVN